MSQQSASYITQSEVPYAIYRLTDGSTEPTFTVADVAQVANLTTTRVRQILSLMVANGDLVRLSLGPRQTKFQVTEQFAAAGAVLVRGLRRRRQMIEHVGDDARDSEQAIFVSYLKEDWPQVSQLVTVLQEANFKLWIDRESLSAGQYWKAAIRNAIRDGAAVIACFSNSYAQRERTYMNEELTLVAEELRMRPPESKWFFPTRLNECVIPDRSIGGGYQLSDIQYVDLFPDFEAGSSRLIGSLLGLKRLAADGNS